MRIEVLGQVRLRAEDGRPVDVAERKLRLLLAALVAAEGSPVSADALVDRLWADDLPAKPRDVLRAKVSHLRRVLDQAQPEGRRFLTHTPSGYRLAVEPGTVDAAQFTTNVEQSRRIESPRHRAQTLREALQMWRGQPYGDLNDEVWLAPAITELEEVRGDAVESLIETLVEDGQPEEGTQAANSAVKSYPTRERLVAAFMLGLYQVGRQHEALKEFESLRRRLAEELGVDPGPQIRELHERILRQDPTLTTAVKRVSAERPVDRRTNLPAETAPLIGRRREAHDAAALLDESRLVTMTGIGGVGKTRLAMHIARERAERSDQECWFIDLTDLTTWPERQLGSADRIAGLVGVAFGVHHQGGGSSDLQRVYDALAVRSALLVLDNCEHVVVEASEFVAEVLQRAPHVRVLATSREPLGLPDEHRFHLDTLDTEESEDGGPSEAASFFASRARAVDPGFDLDDQTMPLVVELCRRLDGLPLALELAATRIRGIAVQDLLAHLTDRLNLIGRPRRGVPRRQQTLRGMIDWSWSLLEADQKTVLRRLAVHPGSLSLEAIKAIGADDDAGISAPSLEPGRVEQESVVEVLIGLVDRSLVTRIASPTGTRYRLLESVAAYAAEKLDEAGEHGTVAHRHIDHYLDFAQQASTGLKGREQREWLARFDAERAQLRHALDTAIGNDDGTRAVALTVSTFWYHWMTGRTGALAEDSRTVIALPGPRNDAYAAAMTFAACFDTAAEPGAKHQRIDSALALFGQDRLAKAEVQWFAGCTLLAAGLREAGENHVDQAIGVLYHHGNIRDVVIASCQRDWFLVTGWGEPPRGLPDGRDPTSLAEALGDGYGLSQALSIEHRVAEVGGHYRRAARAAEQALSLCLDLGLWSEASYYMASEAMTAARDGDLSTAREQLERARTLATEVAFDQGHSFADIAESMMARYTGDLPGARELLDRWFAHGDVGTMEPIAMFEHGFLAIQENQSSRAREAVQTLSTPVVKMAQAPSTARLLELIAALHAIEAQPHSAAELLGTAHATRTQGDAAPCEPENQDITQVHTTVRHQLLEDEFQESFAHGQTLNPREQVAQALATFAHESGSS